MQLTFLCGLNTWCGAWQIKNQADKLKEAELLEAELRQQMTGLEEQVEAGRDEAERLQAHLSMYKHKFEENSTKLQHMEATVSSLQDKLQDSRAKVCVCLLYLTALIA